MSHIRPIEPGRPAARTAWRFFPWYVAGGLVFVMLVNVGMTWMAVRSFPGLATTHAFAGSNGYDRVIAAAERQAALGWRVQATLDGTRPVVTLASRDGTPLRAARVMAVAERPVGTPDRTTLEFRVAAPGRYEATAPLGAGRWDLDLSVSAEGGEYHSLRRLVAE